MSSLIVNGSGWVLRRRPAREASSDRFGARAQTRERLTYETGDLHLGDADALADLRLGEILRETQPQHRALTLGDARHQRLQGGAFLSTVVALIWRSDRLGHAFCLFIARGAGNVERGGAVGAHRLERLQHLLLGDLNRASHFAHRWGAAAT